MTPQAADYRANVEMIFAATGRLYDEYWGEYFHLALFEDGDDATDLPGAVERTHEQYFQAIRGDDAQRIVDIACGGGAFTEWMARRGAEEVVGIDASEDQLARTYPRAARWPPERLRFVRQDVMAPADCSEDPFDAATCLDAACYFPDRPRALAQMAAVLRPGARLLLVDWCRPDATMPIEDGLGLAPLARYWSVPALQTVNSYLRAFAAAGFDVLELRDLSDAVAPSWERGYRIALGAVRDPRTSARLMSSAGNARTGDRASALQFARDQFHAVVYAKVAADAGLLRYVAILGERRAQ